ncbi:DUF397 domain-containing protein [Streptomyces sp. B6B3]|uniref:DUF397 domain-containing protein n=1 Tax=Streptomyces sp. B6B3 TaxID=3153570 RepID=UPI00325DBDCE
MSRPAWQKSSFSGSGGNGGCLEVAASPEGLLLRESEEPGVVLGTRAGRVAALLFAIKAGGWVASRPG